MIGMAFWYLATDQLRNDTFTADTFASSDGWARFRGPGHCRPAGPAGADGLYAVLSHLQLESARSPDALERSRQEPGQVIAGKMASGRLGFAAEDPGAPENFPSALTVWRADLLGSSGKGNE